MTNEEKNELQKLKTAGWNYIFRTDDGYIAVSDTEPYFNTAWWDVEENGKIQELWDCDMFNFISYTDEEPYSINKLLDKELI